MSNKKQNLLESNGTLSIKPFRLSKDTFGTNSLKKKHINRVGKTDNFVVDYDYVEGLILLYGKEAATSHGFKLGLDKNEATAVIKLLKQAKNLLNNHGIKA